MDKSHLEQLRQVKRVDSEIKGIKAALQTIENDISSVKAGGPLSAYRRQFLDYLDNYQTEKRWIRSNFKW